jgi:hypothetical protein
MLPLAGDKAAEILASSGRDYRSTSLTRKRTPLGPYCRPMPRVLGGFWGGGHFLMGEVPLHGQVSTAILHETGSPSSLLVQDLNPAGAESHVHRGTSITRKRPPP